MLKTLSLTFTLFLATVLFALSSEAITEEGPGKQLFEKHCLKCHGDDGRGDTKIGQLTKTPDLNEHPWKRGDTLEDLIKLITEGEGKMPKPKKISQEEIETVAAYTLERFLPKP